jgi:diguanylate cyclase (GGDEF)-like protein/PAS domain S-box-containing protein
MGAKTNRRSSAAKKPSRENPNTVAERHVRELEQLRRELNAQINERKHAEEMLLKSSREYQAGFELAAAGQVHTDVHTQKFIRVNRRLCEMTGYSREELLSLTADVLAHPDDHDSFEVLRQGLLGGKINEYQHEGRCVCKDGHIIWVHITAALIRNSDGKPCHTVAVVQDVTDRRRAEEQLRHDAMHDALTGLANRSLLINRLTYCLAKYRADPAHALGVLYLDLDRFKSVNDTLGHPVGDQLLASVAQRLRESVRGRDTLARTPCNDEIARLGGDEFVLLLDRAGEGTETAMRVAERIRQKLSMPFRIGDIDVRTGASVGIAISRPSHTTADDLLRDADAALYQAKANRGSIVLFDPNLSMQSAA